MKKNQNLIHIRIEENEAIESKRDVLQTEASLIKIAQAIKRYRILRLKELSIKIELFKKIKDLKNDIRNLKTFLPKFQIPNVLKKHEEEMDRPIIIQDLKPKQEKTKTTKKERKTTKQKVKKKEEKPEIDDLELQLKEIQDKLGQLE